MHATTLLSTPSYILSSGTTGEGLPWDSIRAYAAAGGAVAVSANFSVGVPLLLGMLATAQGQLPQVRKV